MSKDLLKSIIADFHAEELPIYFKRHILIPLATNKIITLIGPRRSGKTAQMYHLVQELIKNGTPLKNIVYINFEDERYEYSTLELDNIIKAFLELYPDVEFSQCYFFFDEIQNISKWDKFVRRIYDTITKHIFLSGSNSKLLSREIATSLRGRTLTYQILPFSFREYCQYQQIEITEMGRRNVAKLFNGFNQYLLFGGFPEIINFDEELKIKILQDYFNTMIYRDMVERYDIKNSVVLKYFLKRLFVSATKSISVNKIFNELKSAGIKIAKQQLYDYLDMAESIFLIIIIKKYSPTVINQELGERKIYIIDNGLLNAITYQFSKNLGQCLEQLVLQELVRREETIFFYKEKFECDFIIQRGLDITQAIQVCYDLDDRITLDREIKGLKMACTAFNLNKGLIITKEKQDSFEVDGLLIECVPFYKWILADYNHL